MAGEYSGAVQRSGTVDGASTTSAGVKLTLRSPAWLAARNHLELLTTAPDRIRGCAHERCVRHFFDASGNGTRRWCSMAACGNRAKASRHYARSKVA